MNKATLLAEALRLPEDERREFLAELEESLPPEEGDFALTPDQEAEIDRRIGEHERDPSSALPWEEVREWLWSRRK